ncbi:30S ribosomal protein S19 [Candidatus Woesearchaeota archaeon]|nr:30S ribosomal protein S19 [Candidatus Woesearchaeota archaeon]
MAKKEFTLRGKTVEEMKNMSLTEISEYLPSRERRKIKRGFTDAEKIFLKNIEKNNNVETHCRDMIVLPVMVGKIIKVHNGKTFLPITIAAEMIGHRLGEFALTRGRVQHSAPGIGATRSSASISVR